MQLTINNVEISLISKSGKVFATSLDVAKVFEKKHKNVLRDIEAFPEEILKLNFELKYYISKNNKRTPMYKMNRDGFSLLAMGFTGERALLWKLEFLKAFNAMEQFIISNLTHTKDNKLLRSVYGGYKGYAKKLKKEVERLKKRVEYVEQFVSIAREKEARFKRQGGAR